ncbi:MAG: DUF935 family protein [Candidatus Wallbacteria bacterium]
MAKLWLNSNNYIEFKPNKNSLSNEIATRHTALDFVSFLSFLPDPDPILRRQGKDVRIYRELLYDDQVTACIGSRKAGVQNLSWSIDRQKKAKSSQAKIIQKIFEGFDIRKIKEEILDAPYFGFQPLEVIWEKNGDYIFPSKVQGKPPEWFCFSAEDNSLLFRSKQNCNGEPVPERKFLIASHGDSYDNPYGRRLLSSVFWPCVFKKNGMKFLITFCEKYGMPFMYGKQPRGADKTETDNLMSMLENMVQDAIAVIPDDSSIEFLKSDAKADGGIYKTLIDICDAQISKVILGQTLTTQQGEKGSFSLGKVHNEVRQDIIDSDQAMFDSVMNTLIRWIGELNFGNSDMPVFSSWAPKEVETELAARDKTLAETGVKFTKVYYIKNYGLEEEDFDLTEPAPKPLMQPAAFAEAENTFATKLKQAQNVVDNAAEEIKPEELQKMAEGLLKPIIDLIQNGENYTDILTNLAETYPEMNSDSLLKMLERAYFVSELYGRVKKIE